MSRTTKENTQIDVRAHTNTNTSKQTNTLSSNIRDKCVLQIARKNLIKSNQIKAKRKE